MLRIVMRRRRRDGAEKRGIDAVDGGAEEPGPEPKRAKFEKKLGREKAFVTWTP